jgi:hypothetical protein
MFGTGDRRVVRGGSWNNNARNCRSACRNRRNPGNRNDNQGFRLAAAPADAVLSRNRTFPSSASGNGCGQNRRRRGRELVAGGENFRPRSVSGQCRAVLRPGTKELSRRFSISCCGGSDRSRTETGWTRGETCAACFRLGSRSRRTRLRSVDPLQACHNRVAVGCCIAGCPRVLRVLRSTRGWMPQRLWRWERFAAFQPENGVGVLHRFHRLHRWNGSRLISGSG